MRSKDLALEAYYADYLDLLNQGQTHEEAIQDFASWMHPTTLACLLERIEEKERGPAAG